MRKVFLTILSIILLVTCSLFFACGNNEITEEEKQIIFQVPNSIQVVLGEEKKIEVITGEEGFSLSYISLNSEVASVSGDGTINALSIGKATVKVIYGEQEKEIEVNVYDSGYVPFIKVKNIEDNKIKLHNGDTFTLINGLQFLNKEYDVDYSYTSDNACVSVDNQGKITANSIGSANIQIKCRYKLWDITETVNVKVVNNVLVSLSQNQIELSTGTKTGLDIQKQVNVIGVYVEGIEQNSPQITWYSMDTNVATVNNGLIEQAGAGSTTVVAKYTYLQEDYYGYVLVNVNEMQLASPTGFNFENKILSWEAVQGAEKYLLSDGDIEFETNTNNVDLSHYDKFGYTTIQIQSISNEQDIKDSETTYFNYTFESCSLTKAFLDLAPHDPTFVEQIFEDDFTEDGSIYYVECNGREVSGDYGYMFKKVYYDFAAKNKYGSYWCVKPLFPEGSVSLYYNSKISFWAYSEQETTIYYAFLNNQFIRGKITERVIPAKTWTKVVFTVAETDFPFVTFISSTSDFYFLDLRVSDAMYQTNDYTNISENVIAGIENKINALPSASELNGDGYYELKLLGKLYDSLTDEQKQQVGNRQKLLDLLESYDNKFSVIYDLNYTASTITDYFTENVKAYLRTANYSITSDPVYGKVLTCTTIYGGENRHAVLLYNKDNIQGDLSGCDEISFKVYNGGTQDTYLLGDFGGVLTPNYAKLKAGEWTEVVVKTSDFLSGTYFGILNCEKATQYKYSVFYGITFNQDKVQEIIELIDELPTSINKYNYGKLALAIEKYNTVPEGSKDTITNASKLLEQETLFDSLYKVVYRMNTLTQIKQYEEYGKNANYRLKEDDVYGKVLELTTYNGGNVHAVSNYDTSLLEGLSIYQNIAFKVYNGGTSDKSFLIKIGDNLITNYATLKAGQWTEIVIPVSDFLNSKYFGILNIEKTVYKYTNIYAVKEISATEVDLMIQSIGTVAKESAEAIALTREYYDKLSEGEKAKVTKLDVLLQAETDIIPIAKEMVAQDTVYLNAKQIIDDYIDNFGNKSPYIRVFEAEDIKELYSGLNYIEKYALDTYKEFEEVCTNFKVLDYSTNSIYNFGNHPAVEKTATFTKSNFGATVTNGWDNIGVIKKKNSNEYFYFDYDMTGIDTEDYQYVTFGIYSEQKALFEIYNISNATGSIKTVSKITDVYEVNEDYKYTYITIPVSEFKDYAFMIHDTTKAQNFFYVTPYIMIKAIDNKTENGVIDSWTR